MGTSFPIQGPVAGQGGTGGGHVIEDEGTPLPQQTNLNFTGTGVTASDSGGKTVVDIPGGVSVLGSQSFSVLSGAIYPGITNGVNALAQREEGTFAQQIRHLTFPPGVNTKAFLDWIVPANWGAIRTLRFIQHWTTELPSSIGQFIELQISGVALSDGDVIGAVDFGTFVQNADTVLGLNVEHHTSLSTQMTVAGTPVDGDRVQIQIERDALGPGDNMAGPLQLIGVQVLYNIDSGNS